MPAITVYQPHASLIALGIKPWETKPSPPHGDMCPPGVRGLPGCKINRGDHIAIHAGMKRLVLGRDPLFYGDYHVAQGGTWLHGPNVDLPVSFGAVIATATVADCLPIFTEDFGAEVAHITRDGDWLYRWEQMVYGDAPFTTDSQEVHDITDQLPYGDFTPGRWAWQLVDVEPCDPIPAKGKQGVWRWEP